MDRLSNRGYGGLVRSLRVGADAVDLTGGGMPLLLYVNAARLEDYRAIVEVLYGRSQDYEGMIRPEDLVQVLGRRKLGAASPEGDLWPIADLEYLLGQLVKWGNVTCDRDTGYASTVEGYQNRNMTYGLSPQGQRVHSAVLELEGHVDSPGGLQSAMLVAVRDLLVQLAALAVNPTSLVGGDVYVKIDQLLGAFEALTQEAEVFMGRLATLMDLEKGDTSALRVIKTETLDYLTGFNLQLESASPQIRSILGKLSGPTLDSLLDAGASECGDLLGTSGETGASAWRSGAAQRYRSLAQWFGTAGSRARVDLLQKRVEDAVLSFLDAASRMREDRGASARAQDFLDMASDFAGCVDDQDAHLLYRRRLGLAPARHHTAAHIDADLVRGGTPWRHAPGVEVPVTLRETGRRPYVRRPTLVPDNADAKATARAAHLDMLRRGDDAVATLTAFGEGCLSALPHLSSEALLLVQQLLDAANRTQPDADGSRRARTQDQRLQILAGPSDGLAKITSDSGILTCPDRLIHISATGRVSLPAARSES